MGEHHLSVPPTGSTIDEISDLDNFETDTDSSEEDESITGATVIGIQITGEKFLLHELQEKRRTD